MDKYYHERVTLKHQIPAMIAVLDQDEIEKQFPYGAFIPMHWHRSLEISLLFYRLVKKNILLIMILPV